ncbi:acyl-CoA dehydrogenase family protein [Streptomyces phaeofaciens JCM 4814]|uniref:Acyl-[acyl-carrier-protein] dehydrogenase MbtN n=1 Tax=Streptomyces phaeofaciens TaxID=68254 RepID=A0A918HQA1_9ACTN|nr:acyl-CoA dehydrogenase family protein [Streptomyces phaeofaciens]GGT92099.1 acyl-CoA dehydrogenase [Streptomyces phaeofaciens]
MSGIYLPATTTAVRTVRGQALDAYRSLIRSGLEAWADKAESWDDVGHLPQAVFRSLGEAGVFRERWSRGRGPGLAYSVVLAEETARINSGLGLAATLHNETFIGTLRHLARNSAQQETLDRAMDGTVIGCFAVTEPTGGSDIGAVRTSAERRAGFWRITGQKRFISNAGTATHMLCVTRAEGDLLAFILPIAQPGVTVEGFYPKLGTNGCDAALLRIDTEVPDTARLGARGSGMVGVQRALELERVAVSAQLIQAARQAQGVALAWARRRKQFGSRLIEHQALAHRWADHDAEILTVEALLNSVLLLATDDRPIGGYVAALKLRAADVAQRVVDTALQTFGGRGYTTNFPIERMARDVRLARIGAGTDEVLRELIARRLDRPHPAFDEALDDIVERDIPLSDDRQPRVEES